MEFSKKKMVLPSGREIIDAISMKDFIFIITVSIFLSVNEVIACSFSVAQVFYGR